MLLHRLGQYFLLADLIFTWLQFLNLQQNYLVDVFYYFPQKHIGVLSSVGKAMPVMAT